MGVVGVVMKMLKGPVQEVIQRITSQMQVLQDVQGQFGNFASSITEAWVGEDAEAFASEIQSRLIPEIVALIAAIAGVPTGINNAMDIIDQADSKGRAMINDLTGVFDGIY
jgi:hypothetical protein